MLMHADPGVMEPGARQGAGSPLLRDACPPRAAWSMLAGVGGEGRGPARYGRRLIVSTRSEREQGPPATASTAAAANAVVVGDRVRIPRTELSFQFVRSGGAGGQNVNKVSSKAVLRWSVAGSTSLPERLRERFLERHRRRITQDGDLVLSSQRYRDQSRNIDDCLEKLRGLLLEVVREPVPRRATRPGAAARQRRLDDKQRRAEKKRRRRDVNDGGW